MQHTSRHSLQKIRIAGAYAKLPAQVNEMHLDNIAAR